MSDASPYRPLRQVGPAVVIAPPYNPGAPERVSQAIVMHAGAPRLCVVRELERLDLDTDYLWEQRLDAFQRRARLLRTLDGHGAPHLYAALGAPGRIIATIEEHVGAVHLRELLATLGPLSPPGLALLVGRHLAEVFRRAAPYDCPEPLVEPTQVLLGWDGRARANVHSLLRRDRGLDAGAMVAIVTDDIQWMAPEQVRGIPTARAGMFAIGVLMHEVLLGADPFKGASGFTLLERIVRAELEPFGQLRPDLPPVVRELVERCTRANHDARYASWTELIAAIERARQAVPAFDERDLATLLERQFPKARAIGGVLEDMAASWNVDAARAGLALSTLSSVAVEPWPLRPRVAELVATPGDDDVAVYAGTDSRPMLRAGPLLVDERPVTNAEFARFVTDAQRPPPPHWGGPFPPRALDAQPVTHVPHAEALEYAAWAGKRLPEDHEWELAVQHLGAQLGTGAVWEWTATARAQGHVVRGGRWRDRPDLPAAADNTSWESDRAADVGFRCVADDDAP